MKHKRLFTFIEYVRPLNTSYISVSGSAKDRRKALRQAKRLFIGQEVRLEVY